MLPINPLPPFKAARPLLMLGLAAGATALAIWARRKANGSPRLVRIQPAATTLETLEVPWVTEVR